MAEHNALTGTSLHEPKGVADANSGEAYIADGSGSGVWTDISCTCWGAMRFSEVDLELEVDTQDAWYVVSGANLLTPQTLWEEGQTGGSVVFDDTDNNETLTVDQDGSYWITGTLSITGISTSTWGMSFSVSGADPTGLAVANATTEASDTQSITLSGIITLEAGDTVQIALKNTSGTADIDLQSGILAIKIMG